MKITFFVTQREYAALVKESLVNLRNVHDQAHRFVLDGLEKSGFILTEKEPWEPPFMGEAKNEEK
ncbi:MAG: hypothetical protein D9V45_12880 [Chloroflexi bacterium]|nr:MAG: hypothetical protein D9V45_12880 [Chloroflexota bacterium]